MAHRQPNNERLGLVELDRARQDYSMGKRTGAQKIRRRGVPSQGAGADYHYRVEADWLWMQELAWDIFRNNMAAQSITDRAIDQTLQGGFNFDPQTGDKKADADLVDWWSEVSESPAECDPACEIAFADQEETVFRSALVGGDIFGLPQQDGTVELLESQFCRSPTRATKEKIIHGIQMQEGSRKRLNYWFAEQTISSWDQVIKSQLKPVPAYEIDDPDMPLPLDFRRNVFHVRFPKRANQTRGITAYAPIFDVLGYHDDVQFLKLVQARASSLFVFVRQRVKDFDSGYLAAEQNLGPDVTADKASDVRDVERQYREVAAGSELKTLPGETINPWSANIPNPEFFTHARMLLTFVGINLGMPLVMALMDASETNFSGYRGAVDQARIGFRKNQRRLIARWHRPYMIFKLLKRGENDRVFRNLILRSLKPRSTVNVFKHDWHPPSWPYIEPTKDATADLIRDSNMQTSPRRRCRERGDEWADIYRETVEDRGAAIGAALEEAERINKKYGLEAGAAVQWRDLAPLPTPQGVAISIRDVSQEEETSADEGKTAGGSKKPAPKK